MKNICCIMVGFMFLNQLFNDSCLLQAHAVHRKKSQDSSSKINYSGIINILFPIPALLYNSGKHDNHTLLSSSSNSFYEIYKSGDVTTKFDDVSGLDDIKEDMKEVIHFLQNPEKFRNMGAKIPKGFLMQGPPGTGKTLIAAATAGEVQCTFISVKGTGFSSKWAGVGADRVKELFNVARKYAPSIIFIDEIDAIGETRSNSDSGVSRDDNKTLIALLTEMDGLIQSDETVIVLAATNRVEQLDVALLRPGRFDRIISVGNPYLQARIALLAKALSKTVVSDDVNIEFIARITLGFSGAELAHLVNEAILLALRHGTDQVCMEHIEMAYDGITLGRENKGIVQSEQELWKTAIHEAGHIIGYIFQERIVAVHKVSIVPRAGMLGVAHKLPLSEYYSLTQEDMQNQIVSCLAGRFAEEAFGFGLSAGAQNDLEQAYKIAYDMIVGYGMAQQFRDISYRQFQDQLPNDIATKVYDEVYNVIEKCRFITRNLIADHIQDIEKIAKLLMEKKTVYGSEIYQLLDISQPVGIELHK